MADSKKNSEVKRPKNTGSEVIRINAKLIAYLHGICAYSAFFSALAVGCYLHYRDIVKNSSYQYPDEWFPSVSATIGDLYPERSVFQILIALTSGPRFILLALNFVRLYKEKSVLPYVALVSGVIRTFTCGGWVYITSTDDHDWHDIFMISYIVLTLPWEICIVVLSPKNSSVRRGRMWTSVSFFATIVPLVYWFIQHKVYVVAGAYSVYAYFEWSLIILDIAFDSWSVIDLADIEISVSGKGLVLLHTETKVPENMTRKKVNGDESFSFVEIIINLVNSFMFWTVATSLFLTVWYFPLWHMGLSGYEAVTAIFFIAPLFLFLSPLKRFFAVHPSICRFLTVIFGIGAYKVSDPENRLLSITAGTAFGVIAFIVEAWSLSAKPAKYQSYIIFFLIGLMLTSIAKFACTTRNPIWPIMNENNGGYNGIGIFVGLLAALFTSSHYKNGALKFSSEKIAGGSAILAAFGFGGYFYSLKTFLSDSSTFVTWAWEGYPIRGPTPITGGILHFACFMIGILMAIKVSSRNTASFPYHIIGALSAWTLYTFRNWIGFAGSCIYTIYLVSIAPIIWDSIVGYNIALVFGLGFFIHIILSLANVWTVAYAFVPAGWALRERSDIVLAMSFVATCMGVINYRKKHTNSDASYASNSSLLKPTIQILLVLLALSTTIFFKRIPSSPYVPHNPETGSFTAGIWCIHFGLDNDMWSSERRMRDLISDAQVDIIGLLETDTERLIGGNRDLTQTIAEELGMYADYGPGPNKHTWGAALLSKFPILNSSHHLLPSPVGELAPAIHATLDIYDELVDVVVFHSGQEEDEEDRRLQSLKLQEIMGDSTRPLILLSYLVTDPLEGNYNTYVSDRSKMHDIDSTDWDRWCEYILFRDLKKVAYARISRSTITDTELQIAKFKLLTDEEKENFDPSFFYGNHFVDEEEISEELRMPDMFKGDGVRGHRYHVFDEPRYFAQEQ